MMITIMAIYQSEPLKRVSDAVGGALIAAKYTKIGCAINGEKFNPAQLAVDL